MHDHDRHRHASSQQPPASGRSGSGKSAQGRAPDRSALLASAGGRLGVAASTILGLWLAVIWAL